MPRTDDLIDIALAHGFWQNASSFESKYFMLKHSGQRILK
jgi:hypothetical protein